jgi:cytochrome b561
MTVETESSPLRSFAGVRAQQRPAVASQTGLALLTVGLALLAVIGTLGLLRDSWPNRILTPWINIRVLFGSLLWALVIARFYWCVKHVPPMQPEDYRRLSRHLSRLVYLLLYIVVGLRQLIAIVHSIWHDLEFGLLRATPDPGIVEPVEYLQAYLVYGLFSLITIRVLAALHNNRGAAPRFVGVRVLNRLVRCLKL